MEIVLTLLKGSQGHPRSQFTFRNCCSTTFEVILFGLNKSEVNEHLKFPSEKDMISFNAFILIIPFHLTRSGCPVFQFYFVLFCFNLSIETLFYTTSICLNIAKYLPKFLHIIPSCTLDLPPGIFFCLKYILQNVLLQNKSVGNYPSLVLYL